MKKEKIILNAVKCKLCKEVLISNYTWDLKKCSCQNIFIDGGKEYLKRGFNSTDSIEDLSLVEIDKKIYSVNDIPK